jgi:2,4-dichlorophenol 6-monooxygenase
MTDLEVPVLIVGGGGAGLTASSLLSQLGVESLLINARPSTSDLPKAHVLNQRAMEILRDAGVDETIYARGTPRENLHSTAWYAGFAGDEKHVGRKIGEMETWGAGYTDPDWVTASPCASTNLPQIRLEPILRERAEKLNPGRVRFHHELTGIAQDDEGVTATIRSIDEGRDYTVRSKFLLACDGGRTVGNALGVEMEGPRNLSQQASIHMTADLSAWALDPHVLLRWIWLPDTGRLCVLVPMGPDHWGPESEEWVFHSSHAPDDPGFHDDATIERGMRTALGIGEHPVEIHKVSRWTMEGVVASRLQVGRVLLLGDAAHRHPPTGGLGLNSAIQDVHNVCWKLAAVLNQKAGIELLATYEPERKPVVTHNVERALGSAMNQPAIGRAMGLIPDGNSDEHWACIDRFFSDQSVDDDFRRDVKRAIATQSMEFGELNVEYGYTYTARESAIVPDGTEPHEAIDAARVYQPSTRPGHPLPHAWLEADSRPRLSTLDLVLPGTFLLIAGEGGEAWCEAARQVADDLGVNLDAVRIGHTEGDYLDPRCRWLRQREIEAGGAILVRPDRFVAWRSLSQSASAAADLEDALESILFLDHASKGSES